MDQNMGPPRTASQLYMKQEKKKKKVQSKCSVLFGFMSSIIRPILANLPAPQTAMIMVTEDLPCRLVIHPSKDPASHPASQPLKPRRPQLKPPPVNMLRQYVSNDSAHALRLCLAAGITAWRRLRRL